VYVVLQAQQMSDTSMAKPMGSMGSGIGSIAPLRPWTWAEFGVRLAMWAVMMVAMMVPTAVPMTLVYAAVARKAAVQHNPIAPTFVFVAGYAAVWGLFSIAATAAQGGLEQAALLSPMMVSTSSIFGAIVLLAAGAYQFTRYKRACLRHCRGPAAFLAHFWRAGSFGAFRMGTRLGLYCLGCCWILMALLFVGGVMSLFWIATLAVFVLLEKAAPFGERMSRVAGGGLILAGVLALAL
jgi:predicted metal-binding membrane protein